MAEKKLSKKASETVSKGVFDQVKWERDVAIAQLQALGYSLGEKPRSVDKLTEKQAYEIVYNNLIQCGLFCGKYDAKNGKESYMHGISAVMENIAYGVSEETHDRFEEMFLANLIKSEDKTAGKITEEAE